MHTVAFNSVGGSDVPSQDAEGGDQATRPDDPTKTNHAFVAWHLGCPDGPVYDFAAAVTDDITLFAEWRVNCPEPEKVCVYFDPR